ILLIKKIMSDINQSEEFKLGPVQTKWLAKMRAHPERQTSGRLGELLHDGTLKLCCLGQGLICLREHNNQELKFSDDSNYLTSGLWHTGALYRDDYEALGLRSANGACSRFFYVNDAPYQSLASANDAGV